MALADIIARIESDAATEVDAVIATARAKADDTLAEARSLAEAQTADALERARREADTEAAKIVASARLAARDTALSAKRELVAEAVTRCIAAIEALPADAYVALLAGHVARAARGGESVRVGSADAEIRSALTAEVATIAPGLELAWADDPAPFERGALIEGDRVSATVTPASIVEDGRDGIELTISETLFKAEA